jgi:DNA topoisomerase-2
MVHFDHMSVLRTYESAEQIFREFYTLRLDYYAKRRDYMIGLLGAESGKVINHARFILEKCKGDLTIENKKKVMIEEYDKDPAKAWKESIKTNHPEGEEEPDSQDNRLLIQNSSSI